ALEERLVLQTDPVQWVNQDTQVIRDIDTIESEVGSSSELGIFVEADDVFADDTVAFVHDFIYDSLERYPGTEMEGGLLTASSIVPTVSFLTETPGASIIPPTGEEVQMAYLAAPPDIQAATTDVEEGALNIIFRTSAGDLEE